MPRLYEPSKRVIHNNSIVTVTDDEILHIETPPQRWAYAIAVPPLRSGELEAGDVSTTLRVRVNRGVVGIGTLTSDEKGFVKEVTVAGPSEWSEVNLVTGPGERNGPLVIRNLSVAGTPSRAEVQIIQSLPVVGKAAAPSPVEVVIDPSIFASFRPWSGIVPKGYWTDWTGTLTSAEVWAFPPDINAIHESDRFETKALPLQDEHVLDWVPLVQALLRAGPTFHMTALGAGWGRWIASGAALARQLGLAFKVLGVEAEPQHFEWMARHIKENQIPPEYAILICAAAAGRPGHCWFQVGNPQAWYGQSIVPVDDANEASLINETSGLRRVKAVTIKDVLAQLSPLDYLHMDIQGTEAEFLRYAPEELDRSVGMVNVGTHGLNIETELRTLFKGLGWTSVYDIPIGSTCQIRVGENVHPAVEFGDGVQVWTNPRFPELKRAPGLLPES
jgi:FkbM family methyltransferase